MYKRLYTAHYVRALLKETLNFSHILVSSAQARSLSILFFNTTSLKK